MFAAGFASFAFDTRVKGSEILFFLFCLCSLCTTQTHAGPWVDSGDARTRHHLQFLKDTGIIRLPLTTWPLAWADVGRELNDVLLANLSSEQLWSYRYLRHTLDYANRPTKSKTHLYESNSITPFSHFASHSREKAETSSESTLITGRFAFNLEVQTVRDPIDDDKYRPDGSFLAATAGNWIFGVGAIDRWWGPGWQSSLIMSNNARPAPGVFIRRKESFASQIPGFSWLGPWTVDIFANQLEKERDVRNAKLIGARFTFSPLSFLEFGYSRTAFWGGNDRIEDAEGLFDILLLNDVVIETEEDNGFTDVREESNQLISYDARLNGTIERFTWAVYGQYMTNEEQSYGDAEAASLFGTEASFGFGATHNHLALEIADTRNDLNNNGARNNNAIYDHGSYRTGFRYKGRTIGESAGTNALKYSALGNHYFSNGHQLSWRLSKIKLNERAISNNYYSSMALDQELAEVSYRFPLGAAIRLSGGAFFLKEEMALPTQDISSGAYLQIELKI